jgi:hypothetical protein
VPVMSSGPISTGSGQSPSALLSEEPGQ